ncbi:thiol:disulfide interchange protein [Vibrio sp. 10N.286.49.B3]|uniref:thioredoxin fold domain-containing protein n=1 Tax=Vibrio sp. 10N.286.49.B3 TaxID=1880855 RepID=UPI000C8396B3|nr:thioredoxin fold domain-containing protein [Vibrio sp. 10N.286.49.B3]PMH39748.1 thiol:disulfide interchange protein [Vibrio sp. 10N.286.49.B3]
MSVLRRLPLLTLPFLLTACNGEAGASTVKAEEVKPTSVQSVDVDLAALTARFSKIGVEVINVTPSDVDGLVEIQTTGGVLFSSPNGEHFIAGTLYQLNEDGSFQDVLAQRQAPINAEKIAALQDTMIEYKASNEKYVVTVFTDISCGYCSKLHSQMEGYNALGITVRYLAYPRQGSVGPVAEQMAKIWCAEDPAVAMTAAKAKRSFTASEQDLAQCQQTIATHHQLGRELGITGTPAIFLANGELVSGYLPPAQLLQRLEQ